MKMDKRTQEEMNHMEIIIGKIMRVGRCNRCSRNADWLHFNGS